MSPARLSVSRYLEGDPIKGGPKLAQGLKHLEAHVIKAFLNPPDPEPQPEPEQFKP